MPTLQDWGSEIVSLVFKEDLTLSAKCNSFISEMCWSCEISSSYVLSSSNSSDWLFPSNINKEKIYVKDNKIGW